jgi:ABC-type glycerol-3-phosphate transport system permease component
MKAAATKKFLFKLLAAFIALTLVAFSVLPFLWTIVTSFKRPGDIYESTPTWIPNPATLENYQTVARNTNMQAYFKNTVLIALFSTLVSMVVAVFAAYGFSRFRFPGKNGLLIAVLFTRLLPRVALLIPFYIILTRLSLINTYSGLVLVYLIVGMPIAIWLLKAYMDSLPYEIEEAAVVDGCRPMQTLIRVIIPMLAPAIAAVAMFTFILAWNEFLFPLLIAKDSSTRPISVGLAFYIDDFGIEWGPLMAASVLMSLPAIVMFAMGQKYIVEGLSEGAVKG